MSLLGTLLNAKKSQRISIWFNGYWYRIVDAPKIVRVRLTGSLLKMPLTERNYLKLTE
jgi:hypothetical protein